MSEGMPQEGQDAIDQTTIGRQLKADMIAVEDWRKGEDGMEAVCKHTWGVTEENEERGLYEGDTGVLTACIVGSPEYGNQRVMYGFTPEGTDSAEEVRPFQGVDVTDEEA